MIGTLAQDNQDRAIANFCWQMASQYELFNAFYELLKNQIEAIEEKRKRMAVDERNCFKGEIRIEVDFEQRTISIIANGIGLNLKDFENIHENITTSMKGKDHHGSGTMAYLRIAQEMILVSKKYGEFYYDKFSYNDEKIQPDYDNVDNRREFRWLTERLSNYDSGTVCHLAGLGQSRSEMYDFTFKIEDFFESKKFENFLRDHLKAQLSFRRIDFFLKVGKSKVKQLIATTTKNVKEFQLQRDFVYNEKKYTLQTNFSMEPAVNENGVILFHNTLDPIKLNGETGFFTNHYQGIYRHHEFTDFFSGSVDWDVYSLDGSEVPSFYDAARTHLHWHSTFGEAFKNIMMKADTEYIRPWLDDIVKSRNIKKNERTTKALEKFLDLIACDPNLPDESEEIENADVTRDSRRKCPACGSLQVEEQMVAGKTVFGCKSCQNIWQKRKYESTPSALNDPRRHPEDIDNFTKARKRKFTKGLGGWHVTFEHDKNAPSMVRRSENHIYINKEHKTCKLVDKQHHTKNNFYALLICTEVAREYYSHVEDKEKREKLERGYFAVAGTHYSELFQLLAGYSVDGGSELEEKHSFEKPQVKLEPTPQIQKKVLPQIYSERPQQKNRFERPQHEVKNVIKKYLHA